MLWDSKPVISIEKINDVLSVCRSVLSLTATEITIGVESPVVPKLLDRKPVIPIEKSKMCCQSEGQHFLLMSLK